MIMALEGVTQLHKQDRSSPAVVGSAHQFPPGDQHSGQRRGTWGCLTPRFQGDLRESPENRPADREKVSQAQDTPPDVLEGRDRT